MSGGPTDNGVPVSTGAPAPDGGGSGVSHAPESPPSDSEMDSLIETLRFDPFKDGATPAPKPPKAAPVPASPGAVPPRSEQGIGATPLPPSEGIPGNGAGAVPSSGDALALAADRLTQAADRLSTPQQAAPGLPPVDEVPPYIFDIPPQLLDAMQSENPQQRQAAVQHLVAGTARAVHTNMIKMFNEVKAEFPRIVAQHMQAQAYRDNVRRDFYGQYPHLDNPHLAPTVASVTQQVMSDVIAQGGRPVWGPALAKAIADRVHSLIPGLALQARQPAAPPPAPKPPQIFSPGSRPAQSGGTEADIVDTLFG